MLMPSNCLVRQMFGRQDIEKQARVVATAGADRSLRAFSGKHWNGCGNGLIDYVDESVRQLKPAGVVMNLSGFKYVFGDDIGGLLFPLLDAQTSQFRPFCIVASGRTVSSLKSLFQLTMMPELTNAKYFDSVGEGLEYLRRTSGVALSNPSCLDSSVKGRVPR